MKLFTLSLIFTIFLASVFSLPTMAVTNNSSVTINDAKIFVDVADTPLLRIRHINGRYYLKKDSGVFLIFDKEQKYGFLATQTFFSVDVVWLGKRRDVVHIEYGIEPHTFPEIFSPDKSAKYMLIVPANYVKEKGIKKGMRASFSGI
ncbi:MAG: DUF192 domain-containing protein [Candidatus Campbellbacteria bacterium]|nr:DUF192 domain-containing protein [Candidatus Campbellbacteria bacterium]